MLSILPRPRPLWSMNEERAGGGEGSPAVAVCPADVLSGRILYYVTLFLNNVLYRKYESSVTEALRRTQRERRGQKRGELN